MAAKAIRCLAKGLLLASAVLWMWLFQYWWPHGVVAGLAAHALAWAWGYAFKRRGGVYYWGGIALMTVAFIVYQILLSRDPGNRYPHEPFFIFVVMGAPIIPLLLATSWALAVWLGCGLYVLATKRQKKAGSENTP